LLARKVLLGETKGYRNHPQLERFKGKINPARLIDAYLLVIYEQAMKRDFKFKREKIGTEFATQEIMVTDGQIKYEIAHLQGKLARRDKEQYARIEKVKDPQPHPLFRIVKGEVESWEKV
jgi:hypothetical protein